MKGKDNNSFKEKAPAKGARYDGRALNAAIDEFEAEYPAEAGDPDGPAASEGYRIALIFLAVFGTAAVLAILIPLLRSLALP